MDSVTIMLIPSKEYIAARPKTKDHHLTVAYFGPSSTMKDNSIARLRNTVELIGRFAKGPIPARANGVGIFKAGLDGYAIVDLIDGIGTFEVRQQVENLFGRRKTGYVLDGVQVDYTHGFTPHITREFLSDDFYASVHADQIGDFEFEFVAVGLWHGDQKYEVSL